MYKEVTENIKKEAQRLGVTFEVQNMANKPGVEGVFLPQENKIVLIPECLEETICHEVIHFIQLNFSILIFGDEEKAELSLNKKYVSLWGHFFSEQEVIETASAIMNVYDHAVVRYEIAAYLLQDYPEDILDILKSL